MMSKFVGFFQGCEADLVKAHLTQSKADLSRLLTRVMPNLFPYVYAIVQQHSNRDWKEPDDYVQVGLLAILIYLPKYEYICSFCGERFGNVGDYTNHCREEHGKLIPVQMGLIRYLNLMIRGEIIKLRRYDLARKRKVPTDLYILEDLGRSVHGNSHDYDSATGMPREIVSRFAIEKLKYQLGKEVDKRIKIFISRLVEGATRQEAYRSIYECGLSGSVDSARTTINDLRKKTNRFDKYRVALCK
jgi:hypothetical protein